MAHLSRRWLEAEGLAAAADVTTDRVEAFGAARAQAPTLRAMTPLPEWLRAEGVIGAEPVVTPEPLDALLGDYRRCMMEDRATADRTVARYEQTARRFLPGEIGAPSKQHCRIGRAVINHKNRQGDPHCLPV